MKVRAKQRECSEKIEKRETAEGKGQRVGRRKGEKDQEEQEVESRNKVRSGRKVTEGVESRRRSRSEQKQGVRRDIILAFAALSSALCLYSQDSQRGRTV